jgi:hypothetical protein
MKALLSSTYFGPVQWYQKLARAEEVYIEQFDAYQKQTYRNRCLIATANGVQALTVPVEHDDTNSQLSESSSPISIRISDHGNWRHQRWQALTSAYGDSPFFQYYVDDLRPFFTERWELLSDFNEAIRVKMCELLDIQPHVLFTQQYQREEVVKNNGFIDYREAIRPKHALPDETFLSRRYYQVYEQRHGFLPNLSILDLLCNMGPESIFYL